MEFPRAQVHRPQADVLTEFQHENLLHASHMLEKFRRQEHGSRHRPHAPVHDARDGKGICCCRTESGNEKTVLGEEFSPLRSDIRPRTRREQRTAQRVFRGRLKPHLRDERNEFDANGYLRGIFFGDGHGNGIGDHLPHLGRHVVRGEEQKMPAVERGECLENFGKFDASFGADNPDFTDMEDRREEEETEKEQRETPEEYPYPFPQGGELLQKECSPPAHRTPGTFPAMFAYPFMPTLDERARSRSERPIEPTGERTGGALEHGGILKEAEDVDEANEAKEKNNPV